MQTYFVKAPERIHITFRQQPTEFNFNFLGPHVFELFINKINHAGYYCVVYTFLMTKVVKISSLDKKYLLQVLNLISIFHALMLLNGKPAPQVRKQCKVYTAM